MASIDGYDSSNFASFDSNEEPQQLPNLPVDDVLPQADEVNRNEPKPTVQFKESDETIPEPNVILPQSKKEKEESPSLNIQDIISDYMPYIFAVIFILIAYWYSQRY